MSPEGPADTVPLCVNCENALLRTDIVSEGILQAIKRNPLDAFLIPFWFLHGRSELIRRVSERVTIDWRTVPVNEAVVDRVRDAHRRRQVLLLTSMPQSWARELGARCDCAGAAVIADLSGVNEFDYIGDGRRDLPICRSARRVLIVSSNPGVIARAGGKSPAEAVISPDKAGIFTFMKMIRVHQWIKNLLVLVPLLAAHRLHSYQSVKLGLVAFLAFCLCASSVYVLNDLLDLESDRQHIRKRNRPIAAGTISVSSALIAGLLLLVAAATLAFQVSLPFAATLGIYFVMTLAYSLRLKRQVVVDVMLLAALYTIRVLAGAVATTVVPSFWLLAFSMFLFLSLAVVKRYSEMLVTLSQDKQHAAGRGYSVEDLPVLLSLGVSAGVAAVVVLALYINDPATNKLYPSTIWLWLVPPLMLYWVSRVWMKAHRGELHDDPVVFAMRDWQSLVTLALGGLCFAAAAVALVP